jgi:hypothetical protein
MKKTFIFVLTLFSIAFTLFGQTQKEYKPDYLMQIGPYVTVKGGVNANDVPIGIKNGFNFNSLPDFGATFFIPFVEGSKFGFTVDLAYQTYTFQLKQTFLENEPWYNQFSYFTISPNLHIYGFMFGVGFGFPMSTYSDNDKIKSSLNTGDIATMIDVRIGGIIPVYEDETGRLNININGGYYLTGLFKGDKTLLGLYNFKGSLNPHPAWMSLGLSYFFNIPNTL